MRKYSLPGMLKQYASVGSKIPSDHDGGYCITPIESEN